MNEQAQPLTTRPCPECGGKERVQVVLKTSTYGYSLEAEQPERSTPFFGNKSNTSALYGLTCTTCGYTAHFASDVNNLLPDA